MGKHVKGKWHHSGGGEVVAEGGKKIVCRMAYCDRNELSQFDVRLHRRNGGSETCDEEVYSPEEQIANAELIAKAPEMARKLDDLLEVLDRWRKGRLIGVHVHHTLKMMIKA
jgi:hypothetical protein